MQDIVFKKTALPEQPVVASIEPSPIAPKKFERILKIGTNTAVAAQQLLAPKSRRFTVITPARRITPALPTIPRFRPQFPIPSVKIPRLQSGPLREQLGTPLGKITIIQGAVLLALFGIVVSNHFLTPKDPAVKNVAASATTSYRQFLPVTAGAQSDQPTSTSTSLADVPSSLPLDIWATPWNLASLTGTYHSISAFWGTIGSDGVSITPKAEWTQWDTYIATQTKPIKPTYYLTVSGDPNLTSAMLIDTTKRGQHIANLLTTVQQHGFDGIDIDYEALGSENRAAFTVFVQELSAQFHASGKKVAVTVEARINNDVPMDWYSLGQTADEVRVMAYDYHSQTTGTPGPISPIGWLQDILDYARSTVSANKLVVGLGEYGYDWVKPTDPSKSWTGTGLSADQAIALATKYNQTIGRQTGIDSNGYDIGSTPEFTYTDADGNVHDVWYEDTQTIQAKEALVLQYHPAGVIFWTVGLTSSSGGIL